MNKYGKTIYIAIINEIDNVFNIFHKHKYVCSCEILK